MMEMEYRHFGAADAERITGMPVDQQRIKRARGQLAPISGPKAKHNAVTLGEMVFVAEATKVGLGTDNMTVRGVAGRWIAYWAMLTPAAHPGRPSMLDRERIVRKVMQLEPDQLAPEFAILPIGKDPTWHNVAWTNDASLAEEGNLSVVLNLKLLGEQMAARAGLLVEQVG